MRSLWLLPLWFACTTVTPSPLGLIIILIGAFGFSTLWVLRLIKLAAAWRLTRQSKARRHSILVTTIRENADHHENERLSSRPEDGDWVEVEGHPTKRASNAAQPMDDWEGIIGFLHPFCNAGGGGERVLWAAIKATQRRWPKATCVVYTGDHDVTKATILERVKHRFNIRLHPPTVAFMYLSSRHWVLSTRWPHFTLLGQSLGSLIMAYDAFSLLVPDVFIDTMGYSFTLAFCKFIFPQLPTGAYVHYPTISTDMLGSLNAEPGKGVNAGTGKGLRGLVKRGYWKAFAYLYSQSGRDVDLVMTNSSWTQSHIQALWGPKRKRQKKPYTVEVLFPPVAVEDIEAAIDLEGPKAVPREKTMLYVAQFRAEKNHDLILRSFARMTHSQGRGKVEDSQLVLIGSVRDSADQKMVYQLRLLAHELKIQEQVQFILDASWDEILDWLRKSWIGVNGMWNEHFGIGVVEYQAAGLICVVNDSGGPKADIVVDIGGGATGKLPQCLPDSYLYYL